MPPTNQPRPLLLSRSRITCVRCWEGGGGACCSSGLDGVRAVRPRQLEPTEEEGDALDEADVPEDPEPE